jgi:hypothetical protein
VTHDEDFDRHSGRVRKSDQRQAAEMLAHVGVQVPGRRASTCNSTLPT